MPEHFPAVQDDDPDDVADQLAIGAAMWTRGEREDALIRLRRAAQAASEGDLDRRALVLAKAASGLAETLSNERLSLAPGAPRSIPPARPATSPPPPPPAPAAVAAPAPPQNSAPGKGKAPEKGKTGVRAGPEAPKAAAIARPAGFPKPEAKQPSNSRTAAPVNSPRPSNFPNKPSALSPMPPIRPLGGSKAPEQPEPAKASVGTAGKFTSAELPRPGHAARSNKHAHPNLLSAGEYDDEATSQIDLARDAIEVSDNDDGAFDEESTQTIPRGIAVLGTAKSEAAKIRPAANLKAKAEVAKVFSQITSVVKPASTTPKVVEAPKVAETPKVAEVKAQPVAATQPLESMDEDGATLRGDLVSPLFAPGRKPEVVETVVSQAPPISPATTAPVPPVGMASARRVRVHGRGESVWISLDDGSSNEGTPAMLVALDPETDLTVLFSAEPS